MIHCRLVCPYSGVSLNVLETSFLQINIKESLILKLKINMKNQQMKLLYWLISVNYQFKIGLSIIFLAGYNIFEVDTFTLLEFY